MSFSLVRDETVANLLDVLKYIGFGKFLPFFKKLYICIKQYPSLEQKKILLINLFLDY